MRISRIRGKVVEWRNEQNWLKLHAIEEGRHRGRMKDQFKSYGTPQESGSL